MPRHVLSVFLLLLVLSPAFAATKSAIQERADRFLALANSGYQALYRVNSEAQWLAVTDVTPEHDAAAEAAGKAYAAFNGNPAIISEARELLTHQKELTELTVRQLKQLLLNAAEGPMTNPNLVAKRVAAETKQASILNSFKFTLNGQPITANQIDDKLEKSVDLNERKAVWEASKQSGPVLKPNLVVLRDLRNGVAKEMKYPDYFALEVASYGMTTDEMLKMLDDWMATLRPLYLQLHTWAKYKLAEKFHQPVPKKIPAYWVNNRWGQEWPGLVEAANIDKYFEGRKPEWIARTAEQFYTGLGFPALPESFWQKSDLYPVPPDSKRKKNTHASCWHVDLEHDIRSLQSIEPNARWWKYVADFQGIEPPSPRSEQFCDAASKTHINDTPAYYYNYAFATVFKFQLHDYIARHILHQPPQSCNYADNKEVGTWLNNILKKGGTEDWRKVLKDATGEDISTRAMMDYFKPLRSWLEEQNKGRQIGWE